MKQGRREMNKLQCRNRILKMSRRLFTAKGYENTTIEDVAEAAEISKATLYNYFSSKEDLLQGIADAALEEIRQMVRDQILRRQVPAQPPLVLGLPDQLSQDFQQLRPGFVELAVRGYVQKEDPPGQGDVPGGIRRKEERLVLEAELKASLGDMSVEALLDRGSG